MAKNNIKKLTGASLGAALAVGATFAGVNLIAHPAAATTTASAVFVWNCDGNLCKHAFNDLAGYNEVDGQRSYTINYFQADNVTDDSDNSKVPSISGWRDGTDYYWVKSDQASVLNNYTTWSDFQDYMRDNYQDVSIDPTGAENGASSIATNGDREFRVTIYKASSYYGISNASSVNDLTYYPSFWDQTFFSPDHDISGTTLANPLVIQSYLLEPTVTLSADTISANAGVSLTGVVVASSNIPDSAVGIANDAGKYTIQFNSNYYDSVTFRVTTSANTTHYVKILRVTAQPSETPFDGPENPPHPDHGVNVWLPSGNSNSYSVLANYTFTDGSTRRYTLTAGTAVCQENPGVESASCDGGKGLIYKHFVLSDSAVSELNAQSTASNPPTSVSYTTVRSGSTIASYNGTLAGSDKGTRYLVERYPGNNYRYILDETQ